MNKITKLKEYIDNAKIIFFEGVSVSTERSISDFKIKDSLYNKLDAQFGQL